MLGQANWTAVIVWVVATIVLPILISAYGPEIRRLLDAARDKPRQFRLRQLKYKLTLLERLHNSPYNLLLHFIWNVVFVSEFLITYTAGLWAAQAVFKPGLPFSFPGMVLAGVFGRLIGLRDTINGLNDFEQTTAGLKAEIEKKERPL